MLKITPTESSLKTLGNIVMRKLYPIPLQGKNGLTPSIKCILKNRVLEAKE